MLGVAISRYLQKPAIIAKITNGCIYFKLLQVIESSHASTTYQGQTANHNQEQYEWFKILVLNKEIDLRSKSRPQLADLGGLKARRTHTTNSFVVAERRVTVGGNRQSVLSLDHHSWSTTSTYWAVARLEACTERTLHRLAAFIIETEWRLADTRAPSS
jgi:hypothetical protein